MSGDFEEKFIKPIVNACLPGTLAGLSLAVLQITYNIPAYLKIVLLTGALAFTISAFFIFFYTIYPARKRLWTLCAITFLAGLSCSLLAIALFYITI